MSTPTLESIQTYYDERVEGKIRDFTHANPRIEAGIQLLADWAPPAPRMILEIGCGIGATCWRMARAWPQAEVLGIDVSRRSIDVAHTCFRRPNLTYLAGVLRENLVTHKCDLILLMDVYEHIPIHDRGRLHAAIRSLLGVHGRIVITVPTPATQNHARMTDPSGLQPVDENITLGDILVVAEETDTQLLYYREVGIWHYGDYAHVVLGRYRSLASVALREERRWCLADLRAWVEQLVSIDGLTSEGYSDYLGSDVLRPSGRRTSARFRVTPGERRRVASVWSRRRPNL